MTTGPLESTNAQEPQRERRDRRDTADLPVGDPGALRGSAWLTLQTRHAGCLVKGRPGKAGKPPIVGLLGFADRLRLIWQGTWTDDPFADWWLVRMDRVLSAQHVGLVNREEAERCLNEGARPLRRAFGSALGY